ncbi:PIN domain-containing protein [Escherichia coli]
MLKFMLDTNICIFTIKNKPASVRERFNLNQGRMCISSVTLMELIYGAEKSQMPERNLAVIEDLFPALTFWITTLLLPHTPAR